MFDGGGCWMERGLFCLHGGRFGMGAARHEVDGFGLSDESERFWHGCCIYADGNPEIWSVSPLD